MRLQFLASPDVVGINLQNFRVEWLRPPGKLQGFIEFLELKIGLGIPRAEARSPFEMDDASSL
jgi:hypothetical protein